MGHGAGGLGDDERVAGVGLGVAGVQVGDPAHRQAGQVGDQGAGVAGDRDGQGADRGGLVHDHQDRPVGGELVEDRPQLRLVVGQRLVEQDLPGPVQGDGVVLALADVEADEDLDLMVFLDHA